MFQAPTFGKKQVVILEDHSAATAVKQASKYWIQSESWGGRWIKEGTSGTLSKLKKST